MYLNSGRLSLTHGHTCTLYENLPPRVPHDQMTVKDTANITRKKAQLPQQENLEHPTPVGGSWLKNRYIVNNYILLEPLGTGSYAEVFIIRECHF